MSDPIASCDLSAEIGVGAAARDRTFEFPVSAFETLRARGWLRRPPIDEASVGNLLRLLAAVGRGDLSTGRLFEGHVNAALLVDLFATGAARHRAKALLDDGEAFGVWNTDDPDDALRIDGGAFAGRKNFASGADYLGHALVTVGPTHERQMFLVPVKGLSIDRTWWKPLGMRASGSHIVDFTGLKIEPDWHVGSPGDYFREPWFSAGAVRFIAVQVGGIHAVYDVARDHLLRTGRSGDRMQRQRLASMVVAVETGYLWLDRAAREWLRQNGSDELLACVAGARIAVENAAMTVLDLAEKSIGAAGMIDPHPFERLSRDLRTYLRQPNPDGVADVLGGASADGAWKPGGPSEGSL